MTTDLRTRIAVLKQAEDRARELGLDAGARQLEMDRAELEDELYGEREPNERRPWFNTEFDGGRDD
jgi:hypothetical protein